MTGRKAVLVALAIAAAASACGGGGGPGGTATESTGTGRDTTTGTGTAPTATGGTTTSSTAPPTPADPVLLAAGDIASCSSHGDEATAALLDAYPGAVVATLGDNVYDKGSAREFAACFDPSWGRSRGRMRPAPGNHDYGTPGAAGYFGYFGTSAGDPSKGYYSYDLGAWHVVALNSNCTAVACGHGSEQLQWLTADLAASSSRCTLAYWHHPRFSSGRAHGSSETVAPLWRALLDAGAEIVLAGHEHNYERFAPLDAEGRPDPERGIRSFVVGTGGRSHYAFSTPVAGSEVRDNSADGVLALTLRPGGYDWRFLPVAGATFTDAGSGRCR